MREDWVEVKIDSLLTTNSIFVDGDWVESKDQDPNGSVRLIQLADIGDGKFKDKSNRFMTHSKSEELNCTFLKKDDILIARMPDPLGRACLFPFEQDEAFVTVVDVAIVRLDEEFIDKKFILNMINAPHFRNEIDKLKSGSTRKRISRKNLATLKLPIAPHLEQKAIISKIEQLFSELDNGIDNLKTVQAKLKIYRQAVLKKAFEGELTKEWREKQTNLPTADELLEQIIKGREEHYKRQLQEWKQAVIEWEKNGEIGKKPTKPKKLKDVSEVELDNTLHYLDIELDNIVFQISIKKMPNECPEHKFIGMDCIEPDALKPTFTYKFKEFKSAGNWFNKNHLLYGRLRPYLNKIYKAEYEGVASGEFIIMDSIKNINPDYIKYRLHAKDFMHWSNKQSSGDKPRVKYEQIKVFKIRITSLEEQNQIVQEIESRLSVCDKIEETIETSLAKSEALRQSILKKAFEGKLLSEQELENIKNHPEYESAEALLERIKKERKK